MKKTFDKLKKNPVATAAAGTVLGGVLLGTLLVYRSRLAGVPVVGGAANTVLGNAQGGLNGSTFPTSF